MKQCGYCGRKCLDTDTECPIDRHPLVTIATEATDAQIAGGESIWKTLFDPEFSDQESSWPSWWDRQFVNTPWWVFLAGIICVSVPVFGLCIIGMISCRDPTARRRAGLLAIGSLVFTVLGSLIAASISKYFRGR